jgi:hypothetical protein
MQRNGIWVLPLLSKLARALACYSSPQIVYGMRFWLCILHLMSIAIELCLHCFQLDEHFSHVPIVQHIPVSLGVFVVVKCVLSIYSLVMPCILTILSSLICEIESVPRFLGFVLQSKRTSKNQLSSRRQLKPLSRQQKALNLVRHKGVPAHSMHFLCVSIGTKAISVVAP